MKKKAANHKHFQRRMLERYDTEISRDEHFALTKLIQNAGYKYFIFKQSNSRSIYKVPFNGLVLEVVYDKLRHNIITVLPPTDKEKMLYHDYKERR